MGVRATFLFEEVDMIPVAVPPIVERLSAIVLGQLWWRVVYGVRL